MEKARVDSVLGSAPGSLPSIASGLKAWGAFAEHVLKLNGAHLPPPTEGLIAWAMCFRNAKVFGNYLAAVRFGCDYAGLPVDTTFDRVLHRAKAAIAKRAPRPRAKCFIRRQLVAKLIKLAKQEGDTVGGMCYLLAYCFLLRVRSEALPLVVGSDGSSGQPLPPGRHSSLAMHGGELVLKLGRRKNKQHGSVLRRQCWCSACTETCPVHVLAPWAASLPAGSVPFAGITGNAALATLRHRLASLGTEDASNYLLHDFRRGHAQDLAERGSTLRVILEAGEWLSCAFACYLDMVDAETRAVMEAQWAGGSSDEDGAP